MYVQIKFDFNYSSNCPQVIFPLEFVRVFCSVHRVSPTSASRAVSSEAYLLFYERVADPSRL